ncbi:putative siderophore biosynthesis lipase/esterase [Amniculicola lignicola CBS 123094]|uniref:Putative siderophore biosynthesis lipase/esterase n=1 Tax=Amniculicola lignicola CBS 123094 TaxID=1392246 RepID=A0A6A5W7G7_9PLEO|nr:putative siderophore biosynthesis lipase/esterase [Amniculicola lignicola CBS 123094]
MYSQFWPMGGSPGVLHHYTETLVTFEYTSTSVRQPHSLLFIGGLGDGLATTSYTSDVVQALRRTEWSFFTLNLTSSYQGWGLGHLDRDTDEIAQCVRYIKDYKSSKFGASGNLVLMGHSTGSQCVLHYLYRPNPHTSTPAFDSDLQHVQRPVVDGAIMQAAVSDREAILWVLRHGFGDTLPSEAQEVYKKLEAMAKKSIGQDESFDTILPLSLTSRIGYPSNTPVSCRRFLSLVSPDSPQAPGEDDLFSSDLSDEHLATTFGAIHQRRLLKQKLMVLTSGADQSIPDWVDKEGLLSRWRNATNDNGARQIWDEVHSGVIPGASHALSNDDQAEPRKFLVKMVLGYLNSIDPSLSLGGQQ